MRTQFSDEFAHDAKMARLSDIKAESFGERTWLTKLEALYFSLLETGTRSETARCALELAEACMDLESQMAKEMREQPEEPEPEVAKTPEVRIAERPTLAVFDPGPGTFGTPAPDETIDDTATDTVESMEDDEDEVDEEYDGPVCPHGRRAEQVCWKCRRAEAPWDDTDEISEDIDDVVGRFGD